ncbi:MAG: DUF1501 domain-containing protein [Deltaproteobacteria bacterium]|nr:DUF1501 domain-containing protein [Deltaproteobacteria bacterium]
MLLSTSTRRQFISAALALAVGPPRSSWASARRRSLITVWLDGGPSQLETFDPHPGRKIGGPTRSVSTSLKGASIADGYPRLAEILGELNLVRSLVSKEGDHERATYFTKTGHRLDPVVRYPSVGAVFVSSSSGALGLPRHVALGSQPWPPRGGDLGAELDAFRVEDPGRSLGDIGSRVPPDRLERRRLRLATLESSFSEGRGDRAAKIAAITRGAFALTRSTEKDALLIDDEPASVRISYGDSRFGRGCLVARRLIERGVSAVEVCLSGFDSHAGNFEAHAERARELDPALSSLIRELRDRDALRTTTVLVLGEFGRTPRINDLDGRDHWPHGFSCLVGGAGLQKGIVLGSTDPAGESKLPADPVPVEDLLATVLVALGLDPEETWRSRDGRPIPFVPGRPVARLLRP